MQTKWTVACQADKDAYDVILEKLVSGQSALLSGQADAKHIMDSGFASLEQMKETIQLIAATQSKTSDAFAPAHLWEVGPKEMKKDKIFDDEDDPDEFEYDRLGGGSQGNVFRGKLRGESIAIKQMPLETDEHIKSFDREVTILFRFAHPNVCRFYGACKKKKQGEIGLELMVRSLHDAIHLSAVGPRLTDEQKLTICIGTADGMMFLHGERPKVRESPPLPYSSKCARGFLHDERPKVRASPPLPYSPKCVRGFLHGERPKVRASPPLPYIDI
jgi:hypothetical protein